MSRNSSVLKRTLSTPLILIGILLAIALLAVAGGSASFERTVAEMFIRVILVVGLYIFIGNSGVISFGHAAFMCIGAYGTAWLTVSPMMKKLILPGLPDVVLENTVHVFPAALLAGLLAAVIAFLSGLVVMRLSGIAASIATFAFLAIVNVVYSNWESVTAATSSVVGLPVYAGVWATFAWAAFAIVAAWLYSISRFGLALRATRDEPVAADACGVDVFKERLIAYVISAFVVAIGGVLYGHFIGVVNPDAFYLGITFTTLAMLVVGGMASLSGAVAGVVVLSALIELLVQLEEGVAIGGIEFALRSGVQEIALGVVMIAILVFRPAGLFGNAEFRWRRKSADSHTSLENKPAAQPGQG